MWTNEEIEDHGYYHGKCRAAGPIPLQTAPAAEMRRKKEMACTVENNRLYCTTSETAFGPRFASEEEADEFLAWEFKHYGDPRQFSSDELEDHVAEWKS